MKIKDLFNSPKIIVIVGDVNSGKSNLLYHLYEEAKKEYSFNLYHYGLKFKIGNKIHSIEELEQIKNSVVIIDEFYSLFDLEDTKKRRLIERAIRCIFHNNNVLILAGLPNNFKKFISNVTNQIFYLKCSLGDFINGSNIKRVCLSYKGDELGSSVLNLENKEAIYYDGLHYHKIEIPYYPEYDNKRLNKPILEKNPPKKAEKMLKKSGKNINL